MSANGPHSGHSFQTDWQLNDHQQAKRARQGTPTIISLCTTLTSRCQTSPSSHPSLITEKVSDSLAFRTATGLSLVTSVAPECCQRPGLGSWFGGARLRRLELAALRLFLAALYLRSL